MRNSSFTYNFLLIRTHERKFFTWALPQYERRRELCEDGPKKSKLRQRAAPRKERGNLRARKVRAEMLRRISTLCSRKSLSYGQN